jgi:uncharacterized protein (TIGR03067 family)
MLLIPATAQVDDATRQELQRLQGTWVLRTVEEFGGTTDVTKEVIARLTIKGERFTFRTDEDKLAAGVIRVDLSKKPKWLDARMTVWGRGREVKATLTAIYKIEGDALSVCGHLVFLASENPPPAKRPTQFRADRKYEDVYLGVFQRDRPAPRR